MMKKINSKKAKKEYSWGDIEGYLSDPKPQNKLEKEEKISTKKSWNVIFVYLVLFVGFSLLFISVFNLQVVRGKEFFDIAKNNSIKEIKTPADRGVIFDRNGVQLVANKPSFDVVLNVKELPRIIPEEEWEKLCNLIYEDKNCTKLKTDLPDALPLLKLTTEGEKYFSTLSKILGMAQNEITKIYIEEVGINHSKRIIVKKNVTKDQQIMIKSRSRDLVGVEVSENSDREYLYGSLFSHVLGYTGEASDQLIENDQELELGDIVGKTGVEFYYENYLRGKKGIKLVEKDSSGQIIREFTSSDKKPEAGSNLYLTIDAEVQKKLQEVLQNGIKRYKATGGTAIVEDVQTGEIIGMVSLPDYDTNLFVGGISYSDFNSLNKDPQLPMFNRAISLTAAPGSTYKTMVAAAALQEGAITEKTVFTSTGVMYLGAHPFTEFGGKAFGKLTLIDGIAVSSNHYFCRTMLALGIEKFVPYAEWAGFGERTGIDLPGEARGIVPSPENKSKLAETRPWLEKKWNYQGDDCNSAIGQGITLVTPIQMVNWAATIANGGKILTPHLAKKIEKEGNVVVQTFDTATTKEQEVSTQNFNSIKKGMRETVVRRVVSPLTGAKVSVAAKTGTAQFGAKNERGNYVTNHAWVINFFPYENPKYSMVVFLEAGYMSNNSAQVAREFIDWFVDYKGQELR